MEEQEQFLDKLLDDYQKSFDIERDYEIGGMRAQAYGYFSTVSEKYVLSPKANLWSIHGYEHILSIKRDRVTAKELNDIRDLMALHMAPELVCRGKKYPEKDHMYSYLTVAFICDQTPDQETQKELKNFRFEKDYLMNFRGHAEGHVILMDLSTGKAYSNRAAKHLVEHYEKIFNKGGM